MTPSGAGFEVQAPALTGHAATVDQLADAVEQARSAAASVQLGRHAYGRLCQLVPTLLDPIQASTVTALGDAVRALQQSADDLRAVAGRYEDTDRHAADRFGRPS